MTGGLPAFRAGDFVNYNWNWHIFFEPNPTGAGTYLDMLVSGLWLTIKTALLAWIIALIFGTIIGILRSLPSKTASWIGFDSVFPQSASSSVIGFGRMTPGRCG